jgi:hypothetical protein
MYLAFMFGLFSKKEKPVPVTDLVWLSEESKKEGLLKIVKEKPGALFAAWFDDTVTAMETYLRSNGLEIAVHTYRQLHGNRTNGKEIFFIGHYPLYKKEQELFRSLSAAGITVISSLDEPLFKQFGGERIAAIMKALGAGEGEAVSHAMITSSLVKAQQKIEKRILTEIPASSAESWFKKNIPG